jgi:Family of unknown function (DUF6339)
VKRLRFLRHSALEKLRETVPDNLDAYRATGFPQLALDHSLYFEGKFDIDTDSLSRLKVPEQGNLYDTENCQTAYAAMTALTPYEARDERVWGYLTHTHLLEYARKRWPIPTDNAVAVAHVRTHFFAKEHRQIERDNAGSRLWWMAHLCRRVEGLELRDSLNVLLYRADVRASIIERPTVSQSANLFSAVIGKLLQSFEAKKKLFERATFRRLMREINSVGGAQLLDAMAEEQIGELIDVIVAQKLGLSEL